MDTVFLLKLAAGVFFAFIGKVMERIGQRKGWRHPTFIAYGSVVLWFAIGFIVLATTESLLTGFLAMLVAAMACLVAVWFAAGGGDKKCPSCAETIKAEAVRCRFCGCTLNQSAGTHKPNDAWREPLAANTGRDSILQCQCEFCGNVFRFEASDGGRGVKCGKCGNMTVLPETAEPAAPHLASDGSLWFSCQHCSQQLEVDKSGVGQMIDCPSCHNEIQIPQFQR